METEQSILDLTQDQKTEETFLGDPTMLELDFSSYNLDLGF